MKKEDIENRPGIIELPKIVDKRGNLSFFENGKLLPFSICRAYWIYDVPSGETRGGHAYKHNREFVVALSGSFNVVLDNGTEKVTYFLNRSSYGLYIPNLHWRTMENFSTNSLALIVASDDFNKDDYVFDYGIFVSMREIAR